jgi:hypothetical protein
MTETRKIDLRTTYCVEDCLSKSVVDKYKAMGLPVLLELVETKPFFCEGGSYKGEKAELLLDGCHRSRALFDLGHYIIRIIHDEWDIGQEVLGPLVSKAKILEQPEYNRWYKETYDEPANPNWK